MIKKKGFSNFTEEPSKIIKGEMTDLKMVLTPFVYCQIANINRLFERDTSSNLVSTGETLSKIRNNKIIEGQLEKQGEVLKFLQSYYTILSTRGYLYFFLMSEDLELDENKRKPEEYFYVRGCTDLSL